MKYLNTFISFAADCWGYSAEEAEELYRDHEGNFKAFMSREEIERMFEWSGLPVPSNFASI